MILLSWMLTCPPSHNHWEVKEAQWLYQDTWNPFPEFVNSHSVSPLSLHVATCCLQQQLRHQLQPFPFFPSFSFYCYICMCVCVCFWPELGGLVGGYGYKGFLTFWCTMFFMSLCFKIHIKKLGKKELKMHEFWKIDDWSMTENTSKDNSKIQGLTIFSYVDMHLKQTTNKNIQPSLKYKYISKTLSCFEAGWITVTTNKMKLHETTLRINQVQRVTDGWCFDLWFMPQFSHKMSVYHIYVTLKLKYVSCL